MSLPIDESRPVRPGEELDLRKLEPYLRLRFPEERGELRLEQFHEGYSNLTYLLTLGERELVLRRPPFGNRVQSAHDMEREHRVLSRLAPVFPLTPRPYLYCDDEAIVGTPFFLMERRRGVILHRRTARDLSPSEETARALSEAFVDTLAALHALDLQSGGLADLGWPEGYAERQVKGWSQRYYRAQTDEWAEMEDVIHWLRIRIPQGHRATVIHNDYKYDNLVLDPDDLTAIRAVLDWEMATVGDPLMDLGTSLAYWWGRDDPADERLASLLPPAFPGSLSRRKLTERYSARTGFDVSGILFHYCFGLFKVAVIVQQIYYRYLKGHTRDERFAHLGRAVEALGQAAVRAAERESI